MGIYRKTGISVAIASILAGATVAVADDSSLVLEEVIVTAQKRAEALQSIPIAIETMSSEQLASAGVESLAYLEQVSPSVTVNHNGGYALAAIRGVGSTNQGTGNYSSVAIYVDDVYITRPTSSLFGFSSVEQMQILKGPQGALYGRNATGGAIVITTKTPRPGDELKGHVEATVGDYSLRKLGLSVSGSLTEKLAGSIELSSTDRDGYVTSTTPGTDDLDDRDTSSLMAKLVYDFSDKVTLELGAWYDTSDDSNGIAFQQVDSGVADATNPLNAFIFTPNGLTNLTNPQLLGFSVAANGACQLGGAGTGINGVCSPAEFFGFVANPANLPTVAGINGASSLIAFDNDITRNSNNAASAYTTAGGAAFSGSESSGRKGVFNYLEDTRLSAKTTIEFEKYNLVSVTAYTESLLESVADVLSANTGSVLFSPAADNIGFSTLFDSKSWSQEFRLVSTGYSTDWLLGFNYFHDEGTALINADIFGQSLRQGDNEFDVDSIAAFGQITVPLSETANVTVGARYTQEEFSLTDHMAGPIAAGIALPGFVSVQQANLAAPGTFPTSDTFENVTGRLVFDWTLGEGNESTMFYAGVNTGFKSGNLNAQNPLSGGVDQEEILAYEVGFKSKLAGGRIHLNGAGYFYQYDNIHIQVINSASGATILLNGSNAEISGAELELTALVTDGLTANIALTVSDSEYLDDVVVPGGQLLNIEGNTIAGAPESSVAAGLEYVFSIDGLAGEFVLNGSGIFNGGYFFDAENRLGTGGNNGDSYKSINLNASYRTDTWDVALWFNNVTDEEYYRGGLLANGLSEVGISSAPANLGMTVGYNF